MKDFLRRSRKAQIKIILTIILILFIIFIGSFFAGIYTIIKDTPNTEFDNLSYSFAQTSSLYNKSDKLMENIETQEQRTIVTIDQIPDHVINAFIAIEDQAFYEHNGLDLRNIIASLHTNLQAEEIIRGGSTITQQLVKNVFLSNEQTVDRKIKEAYLALRLEDNMSKDQILEAYLNRINLGQGTYGVQAAAQTYFSKDVSKLTLAEGALLAGIVKSPNNYQPFLRLPIESIDKENADIIGTIDVSGEEMAILKNPKALERQKLVLDVMYKNGYIKNESDYKKAISQTLKFTPTKKQTNDLASYSLDFIKNQAAQVLSAEKDISLEEAKQLVLTGGLKIYSTIDEELQQKIETIYREFSSDYASNNFLDYELDKNKNIIDNSNEPIYLYRSNLYNSDFDLILAKDAYEKDENGDLILTMFPFKEINDEIILKDIYYKTKDNNILIYRMGSLNIPHSSFNIHDNNLLIKKSFLENNPNFCKIVEDNLMINKEYYSYDPKPQLQPQSATVILDNPNGNILAIIGGFELDGERQLILNRAESLRQPGEILTPFSVYMAALESDDTLGTVYDDVPNKYEGEYWPENRDNRYFGYMTLRNSFLENRQTIPAQIVEKHGLTASLNTLSKLGIYNQGKKDFIISKEENEQRNDFTLDALSQGNLVSGINLLKLTNAYESIANDGIYQPYTVIRKITDAQDNILYEHTKKEQQIFSRENSYLLRDLLMDNLKTKPLNKIEEENYFAAFGRNKFNSDYWLIGSSPKYTIGTWFGSDSQKLSLNNNEDGIITIHSQILDELDNDNFFKERPESIIEVNICKKSGLLASRACQYAGDDYNELYIKGTEPKKYAEDHVSKFICTTSGRLATQYCPDSTTTYRSYFIRPDDYDAEKHNNIYPEDYKQAPRGYCNIHDEDWYDEQQRLLEAMENTENNNENNNNNS